MGCSTGEARGGGQHNTVEPPSALTPPRSGPYCRWVSAIGAFMSYLYSTLALALSAQQLSTGGMATDTTAFGGECVCVCVCVCVCMGRRHEGGVLMRLPPIQPSMRSRRVGLIDPCHLIRRLHASTGKPGELTALSSPPCPLQAPQRPPRSCGPSGCLAGWATFCLPGRRASCCPPSRWGGRRGGGTR